MWYSVSLPTEDWELYWHERLAGIACQGVDDSSIAEIVNAQMVEHLPRSFDAFLRLTGTSCGRLWVGSDTCLLYTSPSPRDKRQSRMPSSA